MEGESARLSRTDPIYLETESILKKLCADSRQTDVEAFRPLRSCLVLGGAKGAGASTVAMEAAQYGGAPFVRVLTPSDVSGLEEHQVADRIVSAFRETRESERGVVLVLVPIENS